MVKQNMGQSRVKADQTLKPRKPSEIQGPAGNSMLGRFY